MHTFTVRNGAWVFIGDGKKALILQNAGDAELLNLRRISVLEQTAANRQDTTAVAGDPGGNGTEPGASGEPDWHDLDEERFAATIADELNRAARDHRFKELVVVAPPKTLAELRREWTKDTQRLIAAEIPKDFTHHPIPEIERMLLTHRPAATVV